MNIITKENIDKWLFDYFEGNLTFHEKKEVEQFIKSHPEFQDDFDAWSQTIVEETPVYYAGVDGLQKASFLARNRSAAVLLIFLFLLSGTGVGYYLLNNGNQEANLSNNQAKLNGTENLTSNKANGSVTISSSASGNEVVFEEDKKKIDQQERAYYNNQVPAYSLEYTTNLNKKYIGTFNSDANSSSSFKNGVSATKERSNGKAGNQLNEKKTDYSKSKTAFNQVNGVGGNGQAELSFSSDQNAANEVFKKRKQTYLYKYFSRTIASTDHSNFSKYGNRKHHKFNDLDQNKSDKKYNKIQDGNYSKSTNNKSLAKQMIRFFEKDLALTVYNNRVVMDQSLSSIQAFDGFVGVLSKPRFQVGTQVKPNKEEIINNYFSSDFRIKKFGIGVLVNNYTYQVDINKPMSLYGPNQVNTIQVMSNYRLDIGKLTVSPFVSAKAGGMRLTTTPALADPSQGFKTNRTGYNFNAGLTAELPFMYVGFQANNLYALGDKGFHNYLFGGYQDHLFGGSDYRIVLGTDYRKFITTDVLLSPQMYTDISNGQLKSNFVLTGRYKGFLSGASYSTAHDAKLMLGMDVKRFRVGYSISQNVEFLDLLTHELSIQYIFSKRSGGYLVY